MYSKENNNTSNMLHSNSTEQNLAPLTFENDDPVDFSVNTGGDDDDDIGDFSGQTWMESSQDSYGFGT